VVLKKFVKVAQTQFVSVLELSVVLRLLLNGIIGEMDELVLDVLKGEFLAAGPDVGVFEEVAFEFAVDSLEHSEAPYVELPPVEQKRSLDVLLEDDSPFLLRVAVLQRLRPH